MDTLACTAIRLISPEDTARLGVALAPLLSPGDTVLLRGELGAGKTHLARAMIQARLRAAGREDEVPSPTFTLVQTYHDGASDIWHADLYRLKDPAEVDELGLTEAFDTAICLVEWPERLGDQVPKDALSIQLTTSGLAGERVAILEGPAARWKSVVGRALSGSADE